MWRRFFETHPAQVGMTYVEHMCVSLRLSMIFGIASVKAVIHALLPHFFPSSSTMSLEEASRVIRASRRK